MSKVAAVQMCSSHIVEDNLATAERLITEAANQGAELVVLPEMFPIFGFQDTDRLKIKEDLNQGKIQKFLSDQAKNHKIWLVGGTIPLHANHPQKARAASLVFNDLGELVACYNKIHLFDVTISEEEKYLESATIEAGDQIVVIDTPLGKLGVAVCYDIRFPELFRYLFNQGAEIIAIPAAFTMPTGKAHWELLTRSRAVENFCYVIGAAQGGQHTNGRKTFGHSLIVGPWGDVIAEMDGWSTGFITANIDLTALHEIRKSIPVEQHQKIFFNEKKFLV